MDDVMFTDDRMSTLHCPSELVYHYYDVLNVKPDVNHRDLSGSATIYRSISVDGQSKLVIHEQVDK